MPVLQDQLTATLQGHYAIQREIGHGGMAVVYLARDLKHDRDVALKVLNPHLTEVLGRERFLLEIRLAAQLHHPHLLPLYDSGEADGSLYYVVPYVEGGSLRDRLTRQSRLTAQTALQLIREAAEALDYAHRHNVVHRDIKPENILLDEGHAVVADFGVARAISQSVETRVTQTGLVLGTPAYMSPEQAVGDTVDGRSDVYGLGCVLFELLTGAPPFAGSAPLEIMARRLKESAPRLADFGLSATPRLEDALARALAPTREDRFPTAGELAAQLSAVASEITQPSAPTSFRPRAQSVSLAVLPFVNLSLDPESEYFSDGMTEELISALTKVKGLRVTARTSAFAFKGKDVDVGEIGRRLNVGTVLEGSVRRAGDRLRITAQLVNSADGYCMWSETFDRGMADVFAVQDELARSISVSLKGHLACDHDAAREPPTENLDAYTLYLKGLHHLNQRAIEHYRQAIQYFEASLGKDPQYALPHAGIAHSYAMLGFDWYGGMPPLEAMPRAKASALRALELDEGLPEAHTALGIIRMLFDWDWEGAEESLSRSIRLNPGQAYGHHWLALLLSTRNRHHESIQAIHRARDRDPLSVIINQNTGRIYQIAGHYEKAIEHYHRTLALDPGFFTAHVMLAESLTVLGRYAEALDALRAAENAAGRRPLILMELVFLLGKMGKLENARRVLAELLELATREHVALYHLAVAHYWVGEEAAAFDLIDKAYEQRSTMLPWIGTHTLWEGARTHPRLAWILRKMDHPWQVTP